MALAPDRPDGYLALGTYRGSSSRTRRALEQYRRGAALAPGNADLFTATASAEERLGHWDAAVEHFRQAERLDPRSVSNQWTLGSALLFVCGAIREAREAFDRGLLRAREPQLIEHKAMTYLGREICRERGPCLPPRPRGRAHGARGHRGDLLAISSGSSTRSSVSSSAADAERVRRRPGAWGSASFRPTRSTGDAASCEACRRSHERPSRSSSRGARGSRSATPCSASRWPIWAGRRKRSGRDNAASRSALTQGCSTSAPTSSTSSPGSTFSWRAGEGARPAGAPPEDPLRPLARLAEDRSQLRPAAREPELPEARRRRRREMTR